MIERIKRFIHRKLDGYTFEEYLVMVVGASIFLPFVGSIAAILFVVGYLLYKRKLWKIIKTVPKAGYLLLFVGITILVACLHQNYLGALCGMGMLIIFIFILFYRSVINKRLFEFLIDASCLASLFCFGWALMEYLSIIKEFDYKLIDFMIEDDPRYRINSTFFNANYYAMIIEFLILMCVYKMMNVKNKRRIVYYVITIFTNLLALYLTGCRTAWVPFIFCIPLMFLLNKKWFYFKVSCGIIGIGFLAVLWNPDIFPRIDSLIEYYKVRIDIWSAAIQGILAHPFFGQGPLTYYYAHKQYGGPYTQHAHSIYLDPLLSFGILPLILFTIYMFENMKEIVRLYTRKWDVRLFSLIIGFIITILIHGILDYTIFWVQTSLLFFIVYSASSMYVRYE